MKTFIAVTFALVPFLVFYALLARGLPAQAIAGGFALTVALELWRLSRREIFVFEIGSRAIFAGLGAGYVVAPATTAPMRCGCPSPDRASSRSPASR